MSAIVPYYYAFGDREIVAHFRALLQAAGDTPLLAYTFPERTGNELSAEAFGTLVGDGLAGPQGLHRLGRASTRRYLAAAPDAQMFVGSPSLLLGSLRGGSRGCVAALANLHPELISRWARPGATATTRRPSGCRRRSARPSASSPPARRSSALKRGVAEADGRARRALPAGAAQPARRLTPPHEVDGDAEARSPRPMAIHSGSR